MSSGDTGARERLEQLIVQAGASAFGVVPLPDMDEALALLDEVAPLAAGVGEARPTEDALLAEDDSEIKLVPREARDVWEKRSARPYSREDYERDKAHREARPAEPPQKEPCLFPLPDGRRCLECDTCHPGSAPSNCEGRAGGDS